MLIKIEHQEGDHVVHVEATGREIPYLESDWINPPEGGYYEIESTEIIKVEIFDEDQNEFICMSSDLIKSVNLTEDDYSYIQDQLNGW